jgi:hypothetical protein
MRFIRKTTFRCDLAQRVAGHEHQVLSVCNSHSPDVLKGRTAKTRLECSIELALTEMRHPCEIAQFDLRGKVDGHIALNAARLPKLHESASARWCPRRILPGVDAMGLVQHGSFFRIHIVPRKAEALRMNPAEPGCIGKASNEPSLLYDF